MDTHSPEALQAHLVRGLIDATTPPAETAADASVRAALVIQAFQALAPADALEAMTACQIITLQFVYGNALRALSAAAGDAKAEARLRSQVNTLSRTLHQWLARHEATQAKREKREAQEREAQEREGGPAPDAAANGVAAKNATAAPIRAPDRTPPLPPTASRPPSRHAPTDHNGHAINGRAMEAALALAPRVAAG